MLERKHWYDGWFYANFIDTDFLKIRERLLAYIAPQSKVIDIGCGTGRFAIKLSKKCSAVTGIDISRKMILYAKKRIEKKPNSNINFQHLSATCLNNSFHSKFDYAILSLILHEVPELTRLEILKNVMKVSRQILILDYHTPQLLSLLGLGINLIEFLAGSEHYKNFNNFLHLDGASHLIEKSELNIVSQKTNRSRTFSIFLCN